MPSISSWRKVYNKAFSLLQQWWEDCFCSKTDFFSNCQSAWRWPKSNKKNETFLGHFQTLLEFCMHWLLQGNSWFCFAFIATHQTRHSIVNVRDFQYILYYEYYILKSPFCDNHQFLKRNSILWNEQYMCVSMLACSTQDVVLDFLHWFLAIRRDRSD